MKKRKFLGFAALAVVGTVLIAKCKKDVKKKYVSKNDGTKNINPDDAENDIFYEYETGDNGDVAVRKFQPKDISNVQNEKDKEEKIEKKTEQTQ